MDFSSIDGWYFVVRLIVTLIFTMVALVLVKASTRLGFNVTVIMCAMPSVLAIMVKPEHASASCLAGVTAAALLILGGMLFGKFEQQATVQSETADIKS
jgi:hypothetical protein